jgi:hypothetical protein
MWYGNNDTAIDLYIPAVRKGLSERKPCVPWLPTNPSSYKLFFPTFPDIGLVSVRCIIFGLGFISCVNTSLLPSLELTSLHGLSLIYFITFINLYSLICRKDLCILFLWMYENEPRSESQSLIKSVENDLTLRSD